jgi:LmbE family N-acetylglucosaminyl deacetylase
MKPTPKSAPESGGLLIFGAHPDDAEFGCGGVVVSEARAGRRVHLVVCSRGEAGTNGTPAIRTAEAKKAAALMGATIEFIDLGGDAHMEPSVKNRIKIAALIRRHRPSVVLAPTLVENQHPDHAVVGRLVRDGARMARFGGVKELRRWPAHAVQQVIYYAVSVEAEPRDQQPVFVDVSDDAVATAWTAAMRAHASQMQTRCYADFQLARAAVNGQRAGVRLAIPLFPNDPLVFPSLAAMGRGARRY